MSTMLRAIARLNRPLVAAVMALTVALPAFAAAEPAPTAAAAPDAVVRKTTDDIIALLKQNKAVYAKDTGKLYAMVDERVLPIFDFERMSQWVLGRHWRQASEEQRSRFVQEFRNLLVRTYATALLNYTDQKVLIQPAQKRSEREALVKTEVQQGSGAPAVPIHYSFYKDEGDWKVFDVTIDGVSLVSNYRGTYASKIKQQGIDGLIASLAANNARPAKGEKQGEKQ